MLEEFSDAVKNYLAKECSTSKPLQSQPDSTSSDKKKKKYQGV